MANNNNTTILPPDTSANAFTPSKPMWHPTMRFAGTSMGLGLEKADVTVAHGSKYYQLSVEQTLYHLDLFAEPDRVRLAQIAGVHFGVVLERPAPIASTEPLYDVTNSNGVLLLSDVTHDSASRICDERQAEPDAYPEWQGEITYRLRRGAYIGEKESTK